VRERKRTGYDITGYDTIGMNELAFGVCFCLGSILVSSRVQSCYTVRWYA
jgi:hypothetical protein